MDHGQQICVNTTCGLGMGRIAFNVTRLMLDVSTSSIISIMRFRWTYVSELSFEHFCKLGGGEE